MDASALAKLPAELRDEIYELVLCHRQFQLIHLSSGAPQLAQSNIFHPLALAQTCRQSRHETLPVFYRGNHFVLNTDHITTFHRGYGFRTSWISALQKWLQLMGPAHRRHLRTVDIDIEDWDIHEVYANGKTAEVIWSSILPALRLFGLRTSVALRFRLAYFEAQTEGSTRKPLRLPLQDAPAAEAVIRKFYAGHEECRSIVDHWRIGACLEIVPLIRGYRWNDEGG